MSTTTMTSSNSSTIKKWEKKTWVQALQQTAFGMLSTGGSIYDASSEFKNDNGRGDYLSFDYVGKLTGLPLGEGQTAYGNEEALDIGAHGMSINVTRIPVSNPNTGTIEQQRTNVDFSEVTGNVQAKRAAELIDTSLFMHLAGANPTSLTVNGTTYSTTAQKLHIQGHNAPTAPTSNRLIRAGAAATDQALTSSNTFTLDLIDYALETLSSGDQPIEACADGYYKLFLHPYQATDLKHDSGGKIQWYQNQLAAEQGGKENQMSFAYSDKPIFLGTYGNVKIYQAGRVAQGLRSDTSAVITTVRRAVMVGKDALSFASPFGGINPKDTGVPFKMYSQLSDYDYVKGQDLRTIYGIKKMSPSNADDLGAFVIPTYAASHS